MTAIIITDEAKLRALIQEEVSRAMPQSSAPKDEIDSITLEVAVSFLAENGYPISKAKMYKLTSANTIPYQKFGQKLVFSRKSLLAWAEVYIIIEKGSIFYLKSIPFVKDFQRT